jgi:MFS family permease
MLVTVLFVVGATIGAMYPLGLARLGAHLSGSALPRSNACYLAVNCVGSLTGPMIAGVAMDHLGQGALFGGGVAALLLVLLGSALMPGLPCHGKESQDLSVNSSANNQETRAA